MEDNIKVEKNKRIIRRKNAKLYPIYKMFSWDLLFFYSIEFLFYTVAKNVTTSEILFISGFYLFFRVLCQMPALIVADFLGKRKSIILGNIFLIIYIFILLFVPGAVSLIIGYLVFALGYDIKLISESNLLYDSVSTKGGDGLYSKLDTRGQSLYYILDSISALLAGYFFVINNYLPIIMCLVFIIISTILSFNFGEIYGANVNKKKSLKENLREYKKDVKLTFKFIFNSKRMKAFILFKIIFYSLIKTIHIYRSDLLVSIGIKEEQFSMVFAILTFIAGISTYLRKYIENKFKNRTLTFISLIYIISCIIIGVITNICANSKIIPVILILYSIQEISISIWYILEYKYLKNFTNERTRAKINFIYELIGGLSASVCSVLGGLFLKLIDIKNAFLVVGLISLICILFVLKYMKSRFGLKPDEYDAEDIEFDLSKN